MKHSELRAGNFLIGYEGKIIKVRTVFIDSQPCGWFPCVSCDKGVCTDLGYLSPIEIDEDWLCRFGFHKKDWKSKFGYTYSKDTCPVVIEYFKGERLYALHKSDKRIYEMGHLIKYVHELQNLYKDIVGEELKTIDV